MKPVVFLNSHPIQYFAPLYKQVSDSTDIDLTVLYCSDESIAGKMDKGFGTEVKWDIPLLEGYNFRFLRNRSWKPSIHKGFWGLFNPGIITFLYRQPKSVLVIHGWAYSTHVMALIFGRLFGHTVCLRSETPLNQELLKNRLVTTLKHIYLRFLFLFVNRFLYIGFQNKMFYTYLGVKQDKLLFTPYAVDNNRFQKLFNSMTRQEARNNVQLPADKKIILYSGKYVSKKKPLDLLKSFDGLNDKANLLLVMVGEGECRNELEEYISKHRLGGSVILTGFVNQNLIPVYYRAADIFVMCSGLGETWGLSVNEAMNSGIPVIVSDTCGCAYDLVEDNVNGTVFKTGNIGQLSGLLELYLSKTVAENEQIKTAAIRKVDEYSYDRIIATIKNIA